MSNSEITVSAGKFQRLLDYLQHIDIDAESVASRVNLSAARVLALDTGEALPAVQYARLYRESVAQMQQLGHPIPWAAGLGSEAFELMCRCIINARTLGDALRLAERFDRLVYPLLGYNMRLIDDGSSEQVKLSYRVNVAAGESALAPAHWDRSGYQVTVSRASGLEVWCAFCGWLTGQPLEPEQANIEAPYLSDPYARALEEVFRCPVQYAAPENTLVFPRKTLERRLVQTSDSLGEFLESSVYHLIASEREQASTSAAIKSLVAIDLANGLPPFSVVASSLHMSESSLRRRLQKENTSYQALKDEIRCEVAIDQLLNHQAKVTDLAQYLGFTEPSSFVRSFKNWTGQTPTRYRDRIRELGNG